MNAILAAYLTAALWSSTDVDGEPLDDNYSLSDFAPDAIAQAEQDIAGMLSYCEETGATHAAWSDEQFGHDFWLTRNGHGAGFWDRGEPEGDALTRAAKTFGTSDCYVGDDGLVYLS